MNLRASPHLVLGEEHESGDSTPRRAGELVSLLVTVRVRVRGGLGLGLGLGLGSGLGMGFELAALLGARAGRALRAAQRGGPSELERRGLAAGKDVEPCLHWLRLQGRVRGGVRARVRVGVGLGLGIGSGLGLGLGLG